MSSSLWIRMDISNEVQTEPALKLRTVSDYLVAHAKQYGIIHTNNVLNLQGRRVWGFKGIGVAIQLSDGWQKTWMETPFDEKNKIA